MVTSQDVKTGEITNSFKVTVSNANVGGYVIPMTVYLTQYPTVTRVISVSVTIEKPLESSTVCSITPGNFEKFESFDYYLGSGPKRKNLRSYSTFSEACQPSYFEVW